MTAKSHLKSFVSNLFYYTGALSSIRFFYNFLGKRLTIVTYHRVTEYELADIDYSLPYLFITANTLNKHAIFYKKYYTVISFKDLLEFERCKDLPYNSLIITFDDGYEDNYTTALPILKRFNLPFTLFISADKIGKLEVPWWDEVFARLNFLKKKQPSINGSEINKIVTNIYADFIKDSSRLFAQLNKWSEHKISELLESLRNCTSISEQLLVERNRYLNWDQLDEISEIGSHGRSHISLVSLDISRIKDEIFISKNEIEDKCRERVLAFSYPAGHYTAQVQEIVKQSGYNYAVTQEGGINNLNNKYALKRLNLWEGDVNATAGTFSKPDFAFRLSGLYTSYALPLLRRLRITTIICCN